jgi:hypothetical protein
LSFFRYKRLQERQKDLEQKINGKLSNDIHNVQQTLEYQARGQNQNQEKSLVQRNNHTFQKTNQEKEEQSNKNMTNMHVIENTNIIDHKINADWYASLLMYNSY